MSDVPVTTGSPAAAAPSAAPSTAAPSAPSAPSTPASATATPAAPPSATSAPAPSGEPPRERWDDILNNTRTKTRSEVEAEYKQKYGWADSFQTDPYAFVDSWMDQLASHSQYGPQILAKAARMLQARRGQSPQTVEEPQPDVPIVDQNGNHTGQTYSAAQLKKWRDWDWAQKQSALDQRLQPLEQLQKGFEQQQVEGQLRQQAQTWAQSTLGELERSDPYFKEHKQASLQALADHPEWGDNIYRAYQSVLQTKVYPTINQTAEGKVLATLQTQAAGGTVNPSQTAPTGTPKFKDFGEAIRYYDAHPDEALAMANKR